MKCLNLCWGEHTLLNVKRARVTKKDTLSGIGATYDVNWIKDCEMVDRNGAKELAIQDHMRILEMDHGFIDVCPGTAVSVVGILMSSSMTIVSMLCCCTISASPPAASTPLVASLQKLDSLALRHNLQADRYLQRDR